MRRHPPGTALRRRAGLALSVTCAVLLGLSPGGLKAPGTGGGRSTLQMPAPDTADPAELGVNELGRIPILEWHDVGLREDRWSVSRATFRSQLRELYERGYRPVTVTEFARGEFAVPAGTSPVVLTFDDSFRNHLYFGPDGRPHPDSVVGIIESFASTHPDWRATATFYVFWPVPFRERGQVETKLRWLVSNGYELGNHSYNHDDLGGMTREEAEQSLGRAQAEVQRLVPGYQLRSLALPFGRWPTDPQVAITGTWEGTRYWHEVILLVGDMPAFNPHDARYDPRAVPRVQAHEFRKWVDWLDAEPWRRFVSDGDPLTVTYPRTVEERANVRPGFTARVYDPREG